jgi:hypothetical protein
MRNLNKTIKIDPKFTAEEWQLYTTGMKCTRAANALNAALKRLVNANGSTDMSVAFGMGQVLEKYSKFGANDSEPRWMLQDILTQVYDR